MARLIKLWIPPSEKKMGEFIYDPCLLMMKMWDACENRGSNLFLEKKNLSQEENEFSTNFLGNFFAHLWIIKNHDSSSAEMQRKKAHGIPC